MCGGKFAVLGEVVLLRHPHSVRGRQRSCSAARAATATQDTRLLPRLELGSWSGLLDQLTIVELGGMYRLGPLIGEAAVARGLVAGCCPVRLAGEEPIGTRGGGAFMGRLPPFEQSPLHDLPLCRVGGAWILGLRG